MQTVNLSLTTLKAKQRLPLLAAVIISYVIALCPAKLSAQVPNVSYTSPQVYTTGTAISPLSPSNSGGGVSGFAFGDPVSVGTGFQVAGGLVTDASGNLFLVDQTMTETPGGSFQYGYYIKAVQASDGATVSLTFDSNRLDLTLAIDPDGFLYLADATGIIKHYYNGGAYDILTSEIKKTGGIARDAAGNLYINDYVGGYVKKLPAGGGDLVTLAQVAFPNAIVVDQQGNLYVSDNAGSIGSKLYKIPAGGGDKVLIDSEGAEGLALDADGNLYASHASDGVIVKYTGGTPVTVLSGLDHPRNITIDAANNLYVVTNFKTILKYKATGGYFISPQLPAGLTLDNNTGVISGTPTAESGSTNYTVTTYNSSGKGSTTVNIAVNLQPKPVINYTTPLIYTKGTAIANVTPVNTGSAVGSPGYNSPVTVTPSGPGFSGPVSVAADAAGNLYVGDGGSSSIDKLNAGGGALSSQYSISTPFGIAVDKSGNIYVGDVTTKTIKKIAPGGSATTIATGFNTPMGVAVDLAGDVYVADSGDGTVKKIAAGSGSVVTLASGFGSVNAVAVDAAGNVYVTDGTNNVVKEIAGGSNTAVTIGTGFNRPRSIAIDGAGNIIVADAGNAAIKAILASNGSTVTVAPGFTNPVGVTVDAAGNIYVADAGSSSVSKIAPSGGYFSAALPKGLSLDVATGVISGTPTAVSTATDYTITAYNNSGSNSTTINITVNYPPDLSYASPQTYFKDVTISPLSPTNSGNAAANFGYSSSSVNFSNSPTYANGIAINANGDLFIADSVNNTVKKYANFSQISLATGLKNPSGIALDAEGNLYIADAGHNEVKKVPADGSAIVVLGSGFSNPTAVAVDSTGNVYVADGGNNAIKKIPAGSNTPVIIGSGFNGPKGVAVDALGNVYVADSGNGQVKKIPADGSAVVTLISGLIAPRAVTVDATGNLFIADTENSLVKVIPAGSSLPLIIGSGFNKPTGVAVDTKGVVYECEHIPFFSAYGVKKILPVGGYFINKPLPSGLSIDKGTGIISGTPKLTSPATVYTVTAYNGLGAGTGTVTIRVAVQAPAFSYSSPKVYDAGTAIAALTPANTGGPVAAITYNNSLATVTPSGPPGSGFIAPTSIAIDKSGNVFVADAGRTTINELAAGAGALIPVTAFGSSLGIAVDNSGNIYASDLSSKTVYKVTGGSAGVVASGLNQPVGIAVDAIGNVYIADAGDGVVKKVSANGGGIITIGSGFSQPFALAVDAAGNVYVTDIGNNLVKKIIPGNNTPVTVGTGFNTPKGLAVDAAGNVFVVDNGNHAVKVILAADGSTITAATGFTNAFGIAVNGAGNIYVTDTGGGGLVKVSPAGGYFIGPFLPQGLAFNSITGVINGTPLDGSPAVDYTVTGYNSGGVGSATLNITVKPHAPAFSYGNHVYNAGTAIGTLSPSTTGGAVAALAYNTPSAVTPVSPPGLGLISPVSIAVDKTGNLFIGDFARTTISMIPAGTNNLTTFTGFGNSFGIAADNAGNLYVSDLGSKAVYKLTGGSPSLLASGFNTPFGVAADADGNVYVADANDGVVKKISPDGSSVVVIGSGFTHPFSLAVDAAGNVYVTDSSNSLVKKIIPGNSTPVTIGTGFNSPKGLAVDAAGNVFVADNGNGAVKVILAADGSTITVASGLPGSVGIAVDGAGNIYTTTGGSVLKIAPVGGYFINPFLPKGLAFNTGTGVISGTPVSKSVATDYTVTGYNAGGIGSATLNITIKPYSPAISYNGPQTYTASTPITPLPPVNTGDPVAAIAYNTPTAIVPVAPPGLGLISPVSIAVDKTGNLFVGDLARTIISMIPSGTNNLSPVTGFGNSFGIAIDNASNIYVSDLAGKSVYKITGGSPSLLASGFNAPLGVTVDAAGNVYVADANDGVVKKISPDGSNIVVIGSGFTHPFSLAVDAAGNVYVTDSSNSLVKKIIPGNSTPVTIGTGFNSPKGLAVDAAGNVFVADNGNGAVKVILVADASTMTVASGLSGAVGIAVDGAGNIYTTTGGSVLKMTPVGGYFINPALPKGLTFNTGTGVISGTPLGSSSATDYTVTAYNTGGNATATVNIGVKSNVAALLALSTSVRSLSPGFNATVTTYTTAALPYTVSSTKITASASDSGATIQVRVNGGGYVPVTSGNPSDDLALNAGQNTVDVKVKSEDASVTKTYSISFIRQHSALLNTLTFSPSVARTRADSADFVNFTSSVAYSVLTTTVTPVALDPTSTITVNGITVASGNTSNPIALAVGANTITTVVTTVDSQTKTYKMVITRPGDPRLLKLSFSPSVSLTRVTGPSYSNYTATVPYTVSSVTLTSIAVDLTSSITINNTSVPSGSASSPIALKVGVNNIVTKVTAPDGSSNTYSVTITRQHSPLLNTLTFDPSIARTRADSAGFVNFTSSVAYSVVSTTVTPVAPDPTSTITINGITVASGTTSAPITLAIGANTITTVVTTTDSQTKTYKMVITRKGDPRLSALALSPSIALTRVTGVNYSDYTATVPYTFGSVTVAPTAIDISSAITVNNTGVTSGSASSPITLNVGVNSIITKVTAPDGSSNVYSVTITRQHSPLLASLTFNPSVARTRADSADFVNFTSSVAYAVTTAKVTPVAIDPTSTITVNGVIVTSGSTSGSIALAVGANTILTVGTTVDSQTKTYKMVITRLAPPSGVMAYEEPKAIPIMRDEIIVHQNVSPNGDGNSDALKIDGITDYPDNKLQIMNRAGNLVYEIKGYDNTNKVFDGHSNNGKLQQAGTYFYSLEYKVGNETKRKTGYIVLKY